MECIASDVDESYSAEVIRRVLYLLVSSISEIIDYYIIVKLIEGCSFNLISKMKIEQGYPVFSKSHEVCEILVKFGCLFVER